MRTRRCLFFLLVPAGCALMAGTLWIGVRLQTHGRPIPGATSGGILKPVEPVVAQGGTDFNWRQVESADYRIYVANLRAIGCPEETIRDIVIADVSKLFNERKRMLANPETWRYWRPAQPEGARQARVGQQQVQKLETEQNELLITLLGDEVADRAASDETQIERLSFLKPEKRRQVLRLEASFKAQRQGIYLEADDFGAPPDWGRLKALKAQREHTLTSVLTPEELFEYQLRNDEIADQLRRNLVGFEPTEAEFRNLFKLQKAHEDKFSFIDPLDTQTIASENADRQNIQEAIRACLGEERYQEYRRGSDSRFRELYLLTQRFDLPPATAGSLYDRHLQMQKEITQLQKDPDLTIEQRDQAVRRYQEQMGVLVQESLGKDAYAWFQSRGIETFLGN